MGAWPGMEKARIGVGITSFTETRVIGCPKNWWSRDRSKLKTDLMAEEILALAWRCQKKKFRHRKQAVRLHATLYIICIGTYTEHIQHMLPI